MGTGAAANPDRCHACIAIQTGPEHTLLLDSGSGVEVVRNLLRTGIDLASIEDIFLSHRHSDHIGGLELLMLHCGLHALQTGKHANELDIFGLPIVLEVGRSFVAGTGSVAPMLFGQTGERLDWIALLPGNPVDVHSGVRLHSFIVDHSPPEGSCTGCLVEIVRDDRTYRIVYTGDTRPTPTLSEHAQGADILLHECGGLDANGDFVRQVGHCTAGDAARLASTCAVGHLVLLHIPNERSAPDLFQEARRYFDGRITVAQDLDILQLA